MGDKLLDGSQLIHGITVLISFFVGYRYAIRRNELSCGSSDSKKEITEEGAAAGGDKPEYINFHDNYKMVLVVRNDLKMGKGKIGAQCGHGAVGAYQKAQKRTPRLLAAWEKSGCAKVALKVESERELMLIKRAADARELITCLIRDAGRTQIEPNSKTVLAIGPASASVIDQITGHLKLL